MKSLVPAGLTVAFGGLVDAASAAVASGPGADPGRVLAWVGAALGLSILGGLTKIAERHAGRRLLDELEVRLTGDILEHAASLDVACFEDPASLDLLERARRDPAASFHLFLLNALHVLGDGLQGLTLAAVLAVVEPWLLVPLVVLAVPYGLFQWRTAARRYGQETRYTTRRRWSQYFVHLLTRAPGVTEIKLLDLGPLLLERFRSVASQFRDESSRILWRSSLVGAALRRPLVDRPLRGPRAPGAQGPGGPGLGRQPRRLRGGRGPASGGRGGDARLPRVRARTGALHPEPPRLPRARAAPAAGRRTSRRDRRAPRRWSSPASRSRTRAPRSRP